MIPASGEHADGPEDAELERNRINLRWLVRLRWGAVAGQLVTVVAAARTLDLPLPLGTLVGLIALSAASNAYAMLWLTRRPRVPEEALAGLMGLDVLVLTGLLALSGGPSNPFSTLYLVNIALAAVVLRPAWTWALVTFSLACFGALFVPALRAGSEGAMGHAGHGDDLGLHLEGMWVAFGVSAVFIVYFVQRVTGELARRDRELAQAHAARARSEQLASLATLAAGAAHELASPLSTIAVVARELERALDRSGGPLGNGSSVARDDARLIREQVDRCRAILDRMAGEAGETPGEAFVDVSLTELLGESTEELGGQVEIAVDPAADAPAVKLPRRAVVQALRALAKNAVEATADGSPIAIAARFEDGGWTIEIRDRGAGMPAQVLSRVGEPFFTTKRPGAGMGLGVFLARTVLASLGGELALTSRPGRGTTARIRLPASPQAARAPHAGAAAPA